MRGAGHNSAIVTRFKYKIFDYPKGQNTYYITYFFTEDKLDAFFNQLKQLVNNGNLPKDVNTYALYILTRAVSPRVGSQSVVDFSGYAH